MTIRRHVALLVAGCAAVLVSVQISACGGGGGGSSTALCDAVSKLADKCGISELKGDPPGSDCYIGYSELDDCAAQCVSRTVDCADAEAFVCSFVFPEDLIDCYEQCEFDVALQSFPPTGSAIAKPTARTGPTKIIARSSTAERTSTFLPSGTVTDSPIAATAGMKTVAGSSCARLPDEAKRRDPFCRRPTRKVLARTLLPRRRHPSSTAGRNGHPVAEDPHAAGSWDCSLGHLSFVPANGVRVPR
jgi:hypothetical protein